MNKDINLLRLKIWLPLIVLTKSGLAKVIGFKPTIRILKLFTFDRNWANYLLNREDSLYYKISKMLFNKLSPNLKVLDLGTGTGNLLGEYKSNVTGVDFSTLNLNFSKLFFAKKNGTLINHDIEKKLPFEKETFDLIHLNDTFHYIKNKRELLTNIFQVLKGNGALAIVHSHKSRLYNNINGIDPTILITILKKIGFKKVYHSSDVLTFLKLWFNDSIVSKSETLNKKDRYEAYTIIASKTSNFNKKLKLSKLKKEYIFISPHLDDAILSAGSLISKLKRSGSVVKIATVFTKASKAPYTQKGQEHVESSGFTDAIRLFKEKEREDIKVAKKLGVKHVHLGFIDGAFRKDSHGNAIYQGESLFSGILSNNDNDLIRKIEHSISKIVKRDTIVVGPLGIGGHVDHVIVHEVIKKMYNQVFYWEDYPYNLSQNNLETFFTNHKNYVSSFQIDKYDPLKESSIRLYKTQVKALFPKGKTIGTEEKYYLTQ